VRVTTAQVEPREVLCVTATDGVSGAKAAFERLEGCFSTLRGRRFYGALLPDGRYRACATRRDGEHPAALGLEGWTLPGGLYARTRIRDWAGRIEEIGPAFAAMAAEHEEDPARPSIEFYRRRDELVLLLPIRAPRSPGGRRHHGN